jgi:hypothetical protein
MCGLETDTIPLMVVDEFYFYYDYSCITRTSLFHCFFQGGKKSTTRGPNEAQERDYVDFPLHST